VLIGFLAKFFIYFIGCLLVVAPAISIIYGIATIRYDHMSSLIYIGIGAASYFVIPAMDW